FDEDVAQALAGVKLDGLISGIESGFTDITGAAARKPIFSRCEIVEFEPAAVIGNSGGYIEVEGRRSPVEKFHFRFAQRLARSCADHLAFYSRGGGIGNL